ncbi:MAG TPA: alpha-galactosidase, partial [Armatimonadota bacterium]|nr:alpha-galactosidase [Armatimonadota bacterium]
ADAAWLAATAERPLAGPGIEVVEQTWGTFRLNRSVWEAPLKLAGRTYTRGLGTHAASTIRVHLPAPGRRFLALAGVDDNGNTRGAQPHVTFAVTADDRELLRSGPAGVDDPPLDLNLDLAGARVLTLKIGEAEDGPNSDQADWCEARVELEDGRVVYLDELPILRGPTTPTTALPFSFTLDGKPSADLLPGWERSIQAVHNLNHRVSFRDPAGGLRITAHVRRFPDFPAVEWVLEISNEGTEESPLLERIRPLDLSLTAPPGEFVRLHHPRGSTCEITDFLPQVDELKTEGRIHLAPAGGRSSNGTLPFFHLDWGMGGMAAAVGWSGQWDANLARPDARTVRLDMGQETCHLRLKPGETIRTPRILLQWWNGGGESRGANMLRQLLMAHYCPRVNGELIQPPVTHPTAWSILSSGVTGNETNQLEMLNAAADLGCEVYWLDAYWFPSGFPGGVGTWIPRPEDFPRGLKPLGDAAHARGMQFCLWFEPERVARASQIAREHPELCIDLGQGDLLYDLGNPEALAFMTDLLSKAISDYGVDIYREDFNIDPLPFWQRADAPDRQGITEIRFVEGLYALWDSLVARHPGLIIDNCASGGRRIDLETVSRSYAL